MKDLLNKIFANNGRSFGFNWMYDNALEPEAPVELGSAHVPSRTLDS